MVHLVGQIIIMVLHQVLPADLVVLAVLLVLMALQAHLHQTRSAT
jgi:putative effector of murein hydrolase LrgA (UPF0299 family)